MSNYYEAGNYQSGYQDGLNSDDKHDAIASYGNERERRSYEQGRIKGDKDRNRRKK